MKIEEIKIKKWIVADNLEISHINVSITATERETHFNELEQPRTTFVTSCRLKRISELSKNPNFKLEKVLVHSITQNVIEISGTLHPKALTLRRVKL